MTKHDYELEQLYSKLEKLRQEVNNNTRALDYLDYLQEINRNDTMYGWVFDERAIMRDTLDDLDIYQKPYVRDVLTVYVNELENILLKVSL